MRVMEHISIVEVILRERRKFFTEIRQFIDVPQKIQALFISCFIFLAVYGGVMGAAHSLTQAAMNLIKLPLLFLATLAICTPSLHFFNILFGSRQTMAQTIALILTAMAPLQFYCSASPDHLLLPDLHHPVPFLQTAQRDLLRGCGIARGGLSPTGGAGGNRT